jgi:signal transduction histidine kinase
MEKIKKIIIRSLISFLMTFMRLIIILSGGLKLFPYQKEWIIVSSILIVAIILILDSQLTIIFKKLGNNPGIISFDQFKILIPRMVISIFIAFLLTFCSISVLFNLGSIIELKNFNEIPDNNQIRIFIFLFFLAFEITDVLSKVWLNDKEKIIESKNEELSTAYSTQLRIINSIQHELGNKLPIVHLSFLDLKESIYRIKEIDIDKPIRDPIGNETAESIDTIRKLIWNVDRGMVNSIMVVENMKSIIRTDSESLQFTDTDINEFIRSDLSHRTAEFKNVNFFTTNILNSELRISIDQKQMKILLDNIYSNARIHSFIDKEILYDFWISIFDKKKYVEIVFQTNGNPFPKDITLEKYIQFNYYSGPNGNSGIGGYLIGQVVNNHKGKLSLDPRTDLRPSETSISITLPKKK